MVRILWPGGANARARRR